ncbi:hypothetical protein [Anabaena sp. UHCC 0451]|uniref:hypothetical protein n=1 Tax=Anabaena sp. UHCC 0451 TaxID=2055235 RepID=UPI002B1F3A1F|nr:hypothetical protein [Anabaena sp. UHCC 0451]MEA5578810.1 hypothetical protein [Anabaena sp. UHCC 0451]
MSQEQKNFCFCTLALGKKYRLLTQQLAEDLEKYSPGTYLVIYTDEPQDFSQTHNTLAFQHQQEGILHCYHDKRLVIAEAFSKFETVIFLDADTKIVDHIPDDIQWNPGFNVGYHENLIAHVSKYTPERLIPIRKVASKLNINLETAEFLGESLFIVTQDQGREIEFLQLWDMIGRYLKLNGVHAGQGNTMGLAVAKMGWKINNDGWQELKKVTQHLDASHASNQLTSWDKFKKRFGYHYRLNRARFMALKNFNFYYM